jgi:glycosyltransferase involved in cell wall biosynthesis
MIKPQKIAVLCNYELLPERVGGMDYFFWMFDRQCKENNIQVDWFFPNQSNHGEYRRLTIFDSNYTALEDYFLNFCIINKTAYSHIVTHFLELCTPFFYKIKRLSNSSIIVIDHNPRPLKGYPIKKRIEKKVKGILFSRYVDFFVGVSKYSKIELIKEFGSQIEKKSIVVFNGLDTSKFKRKENFISNNQFIVASHLREDKGIQDLILAVKLLNSEFIFDFVIDIYGEGYYEEHLKKMIETFSLQKFFSFKGSVSNLHELYCNYDYLIHPTHGETFCYTVVESLLCDLPVITTYKHGNVLELVEENINGFLYEATQVNELKNILFKILNKDYKIDDSTEVNTRVNALTLEKMVENHLELVIEK